MDLLYKVIRTLKFKVMRKNQTTKLIFSKEENRRLERVEIISQKDNYRIWNIIEHREDYDKSRFPQIALKEVALKSDEEFDGENDYFIIFLNGLSIKEMRSAKNKGIKFISQELDPREYQKRGVGGYYLVKIKRTYLQDLIPEDQDRFKIIPQNWRRATIREAGEILLSIFFLTGEKDYLDRWHICYGREDRMGKNLYNLVKFSMYDEKLTFLTKSKIPESYDLNSITIRKAL